MRPDVPAPNGESKVSNNTLPKSLHTVTVLMQVARYLMAAQGRQNDVAFTHEAVRLALRILYGADVPADAYGLAPTAARRLAQQISRGAL